MKKDFFKQILPPFLIGMYPIIGLLAFNISELTLRVVYRSLIVNFFGTIILMLIFWGVSRDRVKASLQTTIVLVFFYSYGHVYLLLKTFEFNGIYLFRHRTMLPLWILIALVGLWIVYKRKHSLLNVTYALNIAGLFLLLMPIYQIATQSLRREIEQDLLANDDRTLSLQVPQNKIPPDIYYFILDGYGRQDTLEEVYGYDNAEFIGSLRNSGFFVADCSQSNYAQTQLSLPSSLNLDYLPALGDQYLKANNEKSGLGPLIKQSVVRKSLEAAGYKTIAFETGYYWTQVEDADIYYSPEKDYGILNSFESLLLESTMLQVAGELYSIENSPINKTEEKRQRTLYVLDKIESVPLIRGPKFVFVHLIIPHPPYIFGTDGEDIDSELSGLSKSEENLLGYPLQVEYINMRMEKIISDIIDKSSVPPIIIIQGDHGPGVPVQSGDYNARRMQILNAYYFPEVDVPLYAEITPVNSFRILFNYYFDQDLELRDDISFFSSYKEPAEFEIIENQCFQGK
jgi:hypothetical protein